MDIIWLDDKFEKGCRKVSTFTFYTLLLIIYYYDILRENYIRYERTWCPELAQETAYI